MSSVQRVFMPGDQWLYYKIYTGINIADRLLMEAIAPAAGQMLSNQVINKWFFIRYSDPEYHLRLRFLLTCPGKAGIPMQILQQALQEYVESDLVWKVQLDSYRREIGRYGEATMELSESLFFRDSLYFADILRSIQGNGVETLRWLSAMASVDYLLNDFSFDLPQKIAFTSMVKENYVREFGLLDSRSQLSDKYRAHRKAVEEMLEPESGKYRTVHDVLRTRSGEQTPLAAQIVQHTGNGEKLHSFLSNHTHMMMNRWFRSKQRMHEAVVFDFLLKYYKSKKARSNISDSFH